VLLGGSLGTDDGGCSVVVVGGGGRVVVGLVGFDGFVCGWLPGALGFVVGSFSDVDESVVEGSVVVVSGGVVVSLVGGWVGCVVGGWWPGGAGQHHSHSQLGARKSTSADAFASPRVPCTTTVSCFGCRW
jgi:hypothetical protein